MCDCHQYKLKKHNLHQFLRFCVFVNVKCVEESLNPAVAAHADKLTTFITKGSIHGSFGMQQVLIQMTHSV